ncbi:hypothetical protein ACH4RA_25375 [Streptomyces smyrnaeus]|uniref:hypothetical protein n=1 Tax=Streptomyces TaxID=1883 RepID=UPI0015D46F65|nr:MULTISPECIES: hypothetical protein [unclassified Streptomyces]MBQ0865516.1 hypothetical protein [Streptomyces sp. RK75]MBQ1124680.1 hypothetical protein [Streptomyces sp. B15]
MPGRVSPGGPRVGGRPQRVRGSIGVGDAAEVGVAGGHVTPGGQVERGGRVGGDGVHYGARRDAVELPAQAGAGG